MSKSFRSYSTACSNFVEKMGEKNEIYKELNLFDTRFRLVRGLKIKFDARIAKTKTLEVQKAYIVLFELVGFWNVFEALVKFLQKSKLIEKSDKIKPEHRAIYCKSELYNDIVNKPLEAAVEKLEKLSQKHDLSKYFELIENSDSVRKRTKEKFRALSKKSEKLTVEHIIAFIYMERNLFYHAGATAKQQASYSVRIKMLTIYKEALVDYISLLAKAAFNTLLSKGTKK